MKARRQRRAAASHRIIDAIFGDVKMNFHFHARISLEDIRNVVKSPNTGIMMVRSRAFHSMLVKRRLVIFREREYISKSATPILERRAADFLDDCRSLRHAKK